jgi:NitT/TauT family transport system substrate-binding protein
MIWTKRIILMALIGCLALGASAETKIRFGHFPNVTHAQGVIARHLSEKGEGWFESRLGPDVKIEWYAYNAGPTAMEAFFTNSIDITYVGPNPSLNAYIKSKGAEVRVIAGACYGGAALIVHDDNSIQKPEDFKGKSIATPQLGNTQDVSCRAWLVSQGFKVTNTGGDVFVNPTQTPDQLLLFKTGGLDAVWTVEPWVSRLEMEANGKSFLEETDSLTTVLACRAKFLKENPELVKKIAIAHAELTEWIKQHPAEAQQIVVEELSALTKASVAPELIQHAWKRLNFNYKIDLKTFETFLAGAQKVGFLKDAGDLKQLVAQPAGENPLPVATPAPNAAPPPSQEPAP